MALITYTILLEKQILVMHPTTPAGLSGVSLFGFIALWLPTILIIILYIYKPVFNECMQGVEVG